MASAKRGAKLPDISGLSPPQLKRLREIVDMRLGDRGTKIGYVPKAYLAALDESAEDLEDDADDVAKSLTKMLKSIKWNQFIDMDVRDATEVRTLGNEEVDKLIATGTPSGFGCAKTATTKVDPMVRCAVEHKDHKLMREAHDTVGHHIAKLAKNVFNVEVEARPLKVNVYSGPDGHFANHVDTPSMDPRYLGSAVLEFPTERGRSEDSGELEVYGRTTHWEGWQVMESLSIFMPFVCHRVTKLKEGEVRVTVSFELFRKEEAVDAEQPKPLPTPEDEEDREHAAMFHAVAQAVRRYLVEDKGTDRVGLVCCNQYGRHQELYGLDEHLRDALINHGLGYSELSAHIDYTYSRYDGDDAKAEATVYASGGGYGDGNYPVYPIDIDGLLLLEHEKEEGAAFTGNESRPTTCDMRYYGRVLMVSLHKGI